MEDLHEDNDDYRPNKKTLNVDSLVNSKIIISWR